MSRTKTTPKKPARVRVIPRKNYYEEIETRIVPRQHLEAALPRFDLALDQVDDDRIYREAARLAITIYGNFEGQQHAYNGALTEVQDQMGKDWFDRLDATGEGINRRLVLAAYALGVHCGRLTPAPALQGGAK